jgi:Cof subfamily protein (haloacid dehalogenase superfamily)
LTGTSGVTLARPDLVASDLDGTLLTPDLALSTTTIAGVRRLRDAGVVFVICTGRMLQSARRIAARLAVDDGLIVCYQGALVTDLGSGEWLLHRPVSCEMAADVVHHARAIGRHLNVYVDDELYVEQLDEWARRYAEYAEVDVHAVDDLLPVVERRPPTKLVITSEPDDVERLVPVLRRRWAGRLVVTRSQLTYVEITDVAATKSRALEFVCSRLGLCRERTVACGDGLNDVDMVRWAGLGVVVAEAAAAVRSAADLVVPRGQLGDLFARLAAAPGPGTS